MLVSMALKSNEYTRCEIFISTLDLVSIEYMSDIYLPLSILIEGDLKFNFTGLRLLLSRAKQHGNRPIGNLKNIYM